MTILWLCSLYTLKIAEWGKKGHNYQRCCIVMDRRLTVRVVPIYRWHKLVLNSYNFELNCYTKVYLCFCSLLTVRLQILNYSLNVWLILSAVSYHECISRVATINSKGNGLCIMLPHNYGGVCIFYIHCMQLWQELCEHCTLLAAIMYYKKASRLRSRQPYIFRSIAQWIPDLFFCHIASGAVCLTADNNS